ncbi:MAG: hypothetical protein VX970_09675 [Planctomycetota bacterium]|nr:hypothetical protein [Planctomycetota bacterium]
MLRAIFSKINAIHAIRWADFRILLLGLIIAATASKLHADSMQRSVFLQHGPLPGQAVPIPSQLWQQAMAYGQPISYQTQLGVDTSGGLQQGPMDGEVVGEFTGGNFAEGAFDSYGSVRTWANGIPPRLITAQRYSDAYWRFNIDLLGLRRYDSTDIIVTGPNLTDGAQKAFPSGQLSGGTRISASADLFYSFDLEFAWLGNISWVASKTNQFNWNLVNGGQGHLYSSASQFLPNSAVQINTGGNWTNLRSNLNAFELNTRFRWVGATSPVTGAWILGARYVNFDDRVWVNRTAGADLSGTNATSTVQLAYANTRAINHLMGFQGGGEFFWAVCRGVMLGGNLKGGIYGNHAVNESEIVAIPQSGFPTGASQSYKYSKNSAAFFGEANLMVNAHLGANWYIRGGYTGIFLTGVSSGVAAVQSDFQTVSTNNNLIANGFYGGLEWKY